MQRKKLPKNISRKKQKPGHLAPACNITPD